MSEEHKLRTREETDSTDEAALTDDRERLERVSVELDRCWDLLRQRRALREFGRDPDEADVRPAAVVENYKG